MMSPANTPETASTRYDRFFDLSLDLLCIADFRGHFVRVNRAFERATGYSAAELTAVPYIEFIHPDDRAATARDSLTLLSGGDVTALENRFRRRDGDYRWFAWSATPSVAAGEVYAVARDVTDAVRARQADQLLAAASETLAATLDYRETLHNVAQLIVSTLADWCMIDLVESDDLFSRVAIVRRPELADAQLDAIQANPPRVAAIRQAVQLKRPVLVAEVTDAELRANARDEEHLRQLRVLAPTSAMVVPLIARGRTLGAISVLSTVSGRRYDDRDVALATALANRAALALDNALLFRASQQAQQQIERHAERLRAVAEASRALAEASMDERAVLETVTHQVAEVIGEVCVIRLLSDDGLWLEPVALHHADPEALAFIRAMFLGASERADEGLNGQVIASGRPLLIPRVAPARLDTAIKPEYRAYRERFGGARSILIVPWRLRGRTIGVVSLSRERSDVPYTAEDQALLQDLADRASLALDNARLYREAQSAILVREQFLTVAAHELRSPLTSIRGNAELLLRRARRADVPPDRALSVERLSRLLAGIDRMATLAARLLDVTRMQSGAFEIAAARCDLAPLVAAAVERLRETAPRDVPLAITYEAPPGPVIGRFDPVRIEQVLTNLLENAVKYQPFGGAVRVQLVAEDRRAHLAIADEGIGIAAEDLPRLFGRFARADTAVREQIGGVGIGLYIADQIVRRHGGTIDVRSAVGQGTTFTVRLPLR